MLACLCIQAGVARADQPRDWMFSLPPDGSRLLLDYFGSGAQLSLEHNQSIYGKANTLTTAMSALVTYPAGEVSARASLRILFLSVGVMAAYRTVWRNLSFRPGAPGEDGAYCSDCDRGARRDQDLVFGRPQSTDRFGLFEGRLRLFAPFNDHLVLTSILGHRYEGRRNRSYDWFFANIHDGGWLTRWEVNLFFKDRDWGAIAPYIQMMRLPRGPNRDVEWAFGFNAMTRAGLMRDNDFLLLTFLIRPGDRFYGQHAYYAPVRALLVYRGVFPL